MSYESPISNAMKTLDEVIKAFEVCMKPVSELENCIGCPYADETGEPLCCGEDKEDALHYLKEYKQTRQDLLDGMKRLEGIELMYIHALANLEDNTPLTWDELKQMKGKPVWITWTVKGEWHHGDWNLVHAQIDDRIWFVDENGEIYDLPQVQYGWFWRAYRKEQE